MVPKYTRKRGIEPDCSPKDANDGWVLAASRRSNLNRHLQFWWKKIQLNIQLWIKNLNLVEKTSTRSGFLITTQLRHALVGKKLRPKKYIPKILVHICTQTRWNFKFRSERVIKNDDKFMYLCFLFFNFVCFCTRIFPKSTMIVKFVGSSSFLIGSWVEVNFDWFPNRVKFLLNRIGTDPNSSQFDSKPLSKMTVQPTDL